MRLCIVELYMLSMYMYVKVYTVHQCCHVPEILGLERPCFGPGVVFEEISALSSG